ncbi:MAG: aldehyde ferredoxin oxidoreductase family protein [Bacillota bacterium]|jgi:aldehyde:ferredoxin oxidoreductase|nr:aldehyde:ferredoxin oxidoreductase [Clostridia bacterium]
MDLEGLKAKHKLLAEYTYQLGKIEKGYNNRTLYINIGDNVIKEKPVTQKMKDIFVGGKGFGLWYLWNAVTSQTKWDDPENEIVIGTGPICGITQYPGAGKSLVVTLSPLTGIPIDSNVGGYFGPLLKFSGFDTLEIQGKAAKDIIIVIDGNKGTVRIEEAAGEAVDSHILGEQLTEMYAESEEDKRNVSVISAGSAAEHTLIGLLNFTFYDVRRKVVRLKQAGRGGIGTVFRNKKIKAVVVKFTGVKGNLNNVADISLINKTGVRMHREVAQNDCKQNRMRKIGTANIIEVMDQYDLLPVHNYQFGSHPDTAKIASDVFIEKYVTQGMPDGCWYGCSLSCAKAVDNFELKTGPYKGQRVCVDGPEYENAAGLGANTGCFDPEHILEANFYCDTYGIDTISTGTLTAFVMECYERGIINKDITGGLELNFGNCAAAMELIHQMARGEGFGKIAGQGVRRMKKIFVEQYGADPAFLEDIGMEQKGLEYSEYLMKESLAQQGGYGLCNKGPQHDEAWLIFMDMVNNQIPTFEDKAEALHFFPMFRTWFGLLGLCKLPWNDITPPDNKYTAEPTKVPGHIQNYIDIYEGVTGVKHTEETIVLQSERVYNFQRVFILRMGSGQRVHDMVPYRSLGPVTVEEYQSRQERYDRQLKEMVGYDPEGKTTEEKIKVLRRYRESQYEKLVDAVYKRRGWNENGIPTLETLKKLEIDFPEVMEVVEKYL